MAKKLNKRAKIIIAASVAAILLIGAIISIVLVLAATQQNISSNISIAYVVDGVGAKVSAKYGVVPNSTDVTLASMTTSDGSTTELVFNTSDSQSQRALTPNGNINLTQESGTQVVFEYKFENIAETPFIVGLTTEETGLTKNIKETYYVSKTPLSGSEYGRIEYNTLAVQSLEYQEVLYIYVKVAVANLNLNAAYNKAYNWEMNRISTEKVTVTLNNGSGTGGLTSATAYVGAATPILASVPTAPSGTGFAGYFDGSDVQYINAQGVGLKEIDSAMSLTARYTESAVYDVMGTTMYGISPTANASGMTEVVIPAAITDIADGAFEGNTTITDVNFEGTQTLSYASGSQLKRIGKNAFNSCSSLTSVTIPNSVTIIGDYAFAFCDVLSSIEFGNSIKSIGECALRGCYTLTSVTIPNSVTSLNSALFEGCINLKYLEFPYVFNQSFQYLFDAIPEGIEVVINGGTEIPDSAFDSCINLINVTIGNSVTNIKDFAFLNCSSLTSVTIGNSVTSIGISAFENCSSLTNVTIGDSVTSIGDYAFSYCSGLTELVIPSSVTSIGSDAFYSCSSLTKIEFPYVFSDSFAGQFFEYNIPSTLTEVVINGGTTIPYMAFMDASMSKLTIADTITEIGGLAFYNCNNLNNVVIPGSVKIIEDEAFSECDKLSNITFNYGLESIGGQSIYNSQITSLELPSSLKTVKTQAFGNCEKLRSAVIPNSVNNIEMEAFTGCINIQKLEFPYVFNNSLCYMFELYNGNTALPDNYSNLTEIVINGGTVIPNSAFDRCSNISSITLPNSIRTIEVGAFCNTKITEMTIPNSVTSIGEYAFSSCSSLTSITIPNSVTSVGTGILSHCSNLKKVEFSFQNVHFSTLFSHIDGIIIPSTLTDVVVTGGTALPICAFYMCENIENITLAKTFTTIGEEAFVGCRSLKNIIIPNSVTSIENWAFSGCSSLTDIYYDGTQAQWNAISGIENVSIPNGCTIHYSAFVKITSNDQFANLNLNDIYSVEIGGNVTEIPAEAFMNCKSLTSVIIGNSVTKIGASAFDSCSNLTNLKLSKNLKTLEEGAFFMCSRLTSVELPYGLQTIGYAAFDSTGLINITIPNSVTTIDGSAFGGCRNLTSLTIPSSVTCIGSWILANSPAVQRLEFPYVFSESVYSFIFDQTGMSNLTEVVINGGTTIPDEAFADCYSLTSVTIPSSITSIGDTAFSGCYRLVQIKNLSGQTLGYYTAPSYAEILTTDISFSSSIDIGSKYAIFTNGDTKVLLYLTDKSLTTINDLPSDLDVIGKGAFNECNQLTNVIIPSSVYRISSLFKPGVNVTIENLVCSDWQVWEGNGETEMWLDHLSDENFYMYLKIEDESTRNNYFLIKGA